MIRFGFFGSIRMMLTLGAIVLTGWTVCLWVTCQEISREMTMHGDYGDRWQAVYEKDFGSLSDGRVRIVAGILGILVIPSLVYGLSWALRPAWQKSGGNRRRHESRHASSLPRSVRYRRNALLGICPGLAGIAAGTALVLFQWGIFADHADEQSLGVVVFMGGYLAVISGCWWWLKAKAWTEAVAFIGLLPLAVFFVPFVRLIYVASPAVLPAAMAMLAVVLIGVVFILPDKSGHDGRGGRQNRMDRHH